MKKIISKKGRLITGIAAVLALLLFASSLMTTRISVMDETHIAAESTGAIENQPSAETPVVAASGSADGQPEETALSAASAITAPADVPDALHSTLGDPADVLQVTNLTSTNASAYLTGPSNLQHLQVVGYYTLLNDTEGSRVTVTLDNNGKPYFFAPSTETTAGHITLPSGAVNLTVTSNAGQIVVSFDVSGSRGAAGSFTVNFPFDHSSFDGWVPKGTKLATVQASGENTASAQNINVISNATDSRTIGISKVPNTDLAVDTDAIFNLSFEDERHSDTVRSNWRLQPGTDLTLTVNYPSGAFISSGTKANGTGMNGADDGNGSLVFAMGTADSDGIVQTGWSTVDLKAGKRAFNFDTLKIRFPETQFKVGDNVTVTFTAQYTLYGQSSPTVLTKTATFKLISKLIHLKENVFSVTGGFVPFVSINEPAYESAYMKISGITNAGTDPVPNTCITWVNDASAKRALPNRISFFNLGTFFKYEAVFTIESDQGGPERIISKFINTPTVLGTSSNTAVLNISSLALKPGEYIATIQMYPLNNPDDSVTNLSNGTATPVRELPYGAQAEINIFFRSWDTGVFPDGTTIINDRDESYTSVTLSWENESKPETHKDSTATGNTSLIKKIGTSNLMVYYGLNSPNPKVYYSWAASIGSLKPGAEVSATVNCYNYYYSSCETWKNPVVLLLPPDMMSLNPGQEPTVYKNGSAVGKATITESMVNGKRMYVATLPALTIGRSLGYDADLYKFDLTFTIKSGTLPGRYYLANTVDSEYSARSGLIFGTSRTPNNLAFSSFSSASSFLADTYDFDNYSGTDKLNPPAKATSFDIASSSDMKVSSTIFNNEADNGNGAWQNVTTPGAIATVPLGGIGRIQLMVLNNGNTYLSDVYLLNILPFVGDGKGSEWDARLSRISLAVLDANGNDVTVSDGFAANMSLNYCANGNPSFDYGGIKRTGSGAFSNDTAMQNAKSFLFQMTGRRLPPGYAIVITSELRAPASATVYDIGKLAYNQFSCNANFYSTMTSDDPQQAGQFTPQNQAFKLLDALTGNIEKEGFVFKDINNNDIYDSGDIKLEGVTVSLFKEDLENPGHPQSTAVQTTSTDANGQYAFAGLDGGNYFIGFGKPTGSNYYFGAKGTNDDNTASHINAQTGLSDMFTLYPGETQPARINAAVRVRLDVKVEYRLDAPEGALIDSQQTALYEFDTLPVTGSVEPVDAAGNWIIPGGYVLKSGFSTTQSYTLDWNSPAVTLTFVVTAKNPQATAYTLKFDLNNAPGSAPEAQVLPEGKSPAPVADPTYAGHTFTGWNTKADGSGETIHLAAYTMPLHDVTLYAQWSPAGTNPNNPTASPKTGDASMPWIWFSSALTALATAVAAGLYKRRSKK